MSCKKVYATIFAALLAACAPAPQSAPPTTGDSSALEAEWQAKYDAMVAALALSSEEQDSLLAAFQSMRSDLEAWFAGPEGKRLVELEGQMKDAVASKNLAELKAITSEARPLRDTFEAKIKTGEDGLLNALTPANQSAWRGHRLANHMLGLMEPVQLRPDQITAIQTNAPLAMDQAIARGEPNPPAAAYIDLERWAEDTVLTPDQRAVYDTVKKKHAMRTLTY